MLLILKKSKHKRPKKYLAYINFIIFDNICFVMNYFKNDDNYLKLL